MTNQFKEGDWVICVNTSDALNPEVVLGAKYKISKVWKWDNIDAIREDGVVINNYKSRRFALCEDPTKEYDLCKAFTNEVNKDHYDGIIKENEELKNELKSVKNQNSIWQKKCFEYIDEIVVWKNKFNQFQKILDEIKKLR